MRPNIILLRLAIILSLTVLPIHAQAGQAALPAAVNLDSGWSLVDGSKIDAGGDLVSTDGFTPAGWYAAVVPGTVLTSLVQDGVYPEPLYGENNRSIPESLNKTFYWYRTKFTVPASYAGKRIWLNFDGINYCAVVWLNGHDVGQIKGAFTRGIFDVTAYANAGKLNTLAVQILPMLHPGIPHEHTQALGTGRNGGYTAEDGPTFLATIGWDWIPAIRDRDMGIWQGVSLSCSGPVVIRNPYVTSDLPLPRTDTAELALQTTLQNVTGSVEPGLLTAAFGTTSVRYPVTLAPYETRTVTLTSANTPQLLVEHPRLWWPNGYGPQNLYTMRLSFTTGGTVSDGQHFQFGVRTVSYTRPGSGNLAITVNGVPIMVKGGDWGMDEAMKRIPRSRLDAEIRMHKLANYTMIRNWVGQSTSEDFYDLCDKYGLLVWDEFFQPNPVDGPNPDDTALYLANVREKILRFRNHPSIVLWCARNEGNPPLIIDKGIQDAINDLEWDRLYQRSSGEGRGVGSGGPYSWRAPETYYTYAPKEAFKTEIGSVSVPTLESIEAMMPEKDWGGLNDDWAEHDLCPGAQGGDWYPYALSARYGPVTSLEDFVRKAQMADYESYRAMYEGRFAKLFNPENGVLTWMSNPAQPSFVWQIYSHDLEPNSALFAVREACEPVHIQMNQDDFHAVIVNNRPQLLSGLTATITIYSLGGDVISSESQKAAAAPSAATDLGVVSWPVEARVLRVVFVKLALRDSSNRLLSENFYWRAQPSRPDDFTALNDLPTASLTASTIRHDVGSECVIDTTLVNATHSIALLAHLQLRDARTGARVLPAFYSDNYVSLAPGDSRTFEVEAAKSDLNGDTPLLVLDGWNVGVGASNGPVAVENNPNAAQNHPWAALTYDTRIHCGGNAVGPFESDRRFRGGIAVTTSAAIDVSAPSTGPEALYQTQRTGFISYTIPVQPVASGSYTVRMHFAETYYATAGMRPFSIWINGKELLSNFDIYTAAGGKDKAVVEEFPGVQADPQGNISISLRPLGFARTLPQPTIGGLEIIQESRD